MPVMRCRSSNSDCLARRQRHQDFERPPHGQGIVTSGICTKPGRPRHDAWPGIHSRLCAAIVHKRTSSKSHIRRHPESSHRNLMNCRGRSFLSSAANTAGPTKPVDNFPLESLANLACSLTFLSNSGAPRHCEQRPSDARPMFRKNPERRRSTGTDAVCHPCHSTRW